MPLRRTLATTAAAVLLTAPLLTSCGFNLSTDRVNDNTAGGQDRSGVVDVLAAVVVSSQPGEGTFIASLSNNDQEAAHALVSVDGVTGGTTNADAADIDEVTIPPGGFVNLADGDGVKLTGDFDAGDVVRLAVGFDNDQTITLNVPVVRACEEYAGLDPAVTESSTPTASPTDAPETVDPSGAATNRASAEPTDEASDEATDEASGEATDDASDEPSASPSTRASRSSSPSATPSAYACTYASIGSLPDNEQQSE